MITDFEAEGSVSSIAQWQVTANEHKPSDYEVKTVFWHHTSGISHLPALWNVQTLPSGTILTNNS